VAFGRHGRDEIGTISSKRVVGSMKQPRIRRKCEVYSYIPNCQEVISRLLLFFVRSGGYLWRRGENNWVQWNAKRGCRECGHSIRSDREDLGTLYVVGRVVNRRSCIWSESFEMSPAREVTNYPPSCPSTVAQWFCHDET
jgi:hypothetical protein